MRMEALLELVKVAGPFAALLVFFIWRDYRRELFLTKRINDVEDYQKQRLEAIAVMSVEALTKNAAANDRLARILEKKPCIAGEIDG